MDITVNNVAFITKGIIIDVLYPKTIAILQLPVKEEDGSTPT